MCSRSRAVAECSTSCTGSMPRTLSSAFDAASKTRTSQPKIRRYQMVDVASATAVGSGRAIARFLGNSSPKSIWTKVENSSASTVPTATPTPVGTLSRPRASPRARPMSGSAT